MVMMMMMTIMVMTMKVELTMVMTMTMVVTTMMEAELVGPNTPPLRILLTQVKNMVVVAAAW